MASDAENASIWWRHIAYVCVNIPSQHWYSHCLVSADGVYADSLAFSPQIPFTDAIMADTARLMWLDYLIFSLMLVISLGIGVYHACSGGKQRTTFEYLLGNRAMGIAPVAISLMVTYSSAVTLLGYPAEVYAHGPQWFVATAGTMAGCLGAMFLFLPVLYPLKLTSVNEVSRTADSFYILSLEKIADIFQTMFSKVFFLNEILCIWLTYVPSGLMDNTSALVWVKALCWIGKTSLSGPILTKFIERYMYMCKQALMN